MNHKLSMFLTCILALSPVSVMGQEGATIQGTVTSEAGEPLPGANVFLQYTTYGTATDAEGVYSLRVPAAMATDQQMELVAKFIGYRTKTAKIKLSPGTTTQNFALAQDVLELEGIVVTGLGETVKEKLGVTIAQVKPELVAQVDQSNIVSALSGKVANVEITKTSGDAGTNTFIQIRGTSTIDQSNQPLFVVDGSPISNRTEYLNGANGGTESQNRASDINLEDIGSIEILKGAAASAVYGSRASNGVILVTTKSGKPGKTKISYKSSWGINKQSEFYPMQQWFGQGTGGIFRRDNSRTWGQPLNVQGAPHYNPNIPYVAVYGTDTLRQVYDHARELTGTGNSNDNNITISGGNQYTTFFLSLGRTYEKAHWKAGSDYERYTARVKASQVITEEFKLTGNIAYVNTAGNYLQRGDNLFGLAIGQLRTPPDFNNLPYIDPKTGLHRSYRYSQPTVLRRNRGHDNPFWTMYEDVNTADLDRVYGNVNFEYDPYNWLNLQYTFGSDYSLDDRTTVLPPGGTAEDGNGRVRRATYGYQELDGNLVATVWANKFLHFWNINPTFMFGHNFNRRKYHQLLSTGVNMGVAGFNQLDNAVAQEPDEYEFLVHTESYFGQLTVDFYNQLYLTGALRNEGSSTFGFSEKRHWYPKLSAAWDFTKQFTNLPLIEYGKLRAAYGEAGVQPGVYTLASGYFTGTFGVGWNPELNLIYRGIQGFRSENTLENQDVKPERTRELEFGTNLAFWNSRIGVDFTYYNARSTDVLFDFNIPPSTGFFQQVQNAAVIENKGVEVTLDLAPIRKRNFSWNLSLNFARNRNIVIEMAGRTAEDIRTGRKPEIWEGIGRWSYASPGHPLGEMRLLSWVRFGFGMTAMEDGQLINIDEKYAGQWKKYDVYVPTNGYPIMAEQEIWSGFDSNPDWTAGLRSEFTLFKNVTISGLLDIKQGFEIMNHGKGALYDYGTHKDTEVRGQKGPINQWFKHGEKAIGPGATNGVGNEIVYNETFFRGVASGFTGDGFLFVEDASYVKLKEIAISYKLQNSFIKNLGLSDMSIRLSGWNLVTWTDYTGYDPESNRQQGTNARDSDYFNQPQTRSFNVTLYVNY